MLSEESRAAFSNPDFIKSAIAASHDIIDHHYDYDVLPVGKLSVEQQGEVQVLTTVEIEKDDTGPEEQRHLRVA